MIEEMPTINLNEIIKAFPHMSANDQYVWMGFIFAFSLSHDIKDYIDEDLYNQIVNYGKE